jgi:hypothetical protein
MILTFNEYNPRFMRDYLDKEYFEIIDKFIEASIERCFVKYFPSIEGHINLFKTNDYHEYVTSKEICTILKISRQTLNNWYKKENTGTLLKGTKIRKGKKNLYKVNEIKRIIENYEWDFGKGNIYNYKIEAMEQAPEKLNPSFEKAIMQKSGEPTYEELVQKMKSGLELSEDEIKIYRKYDV